jgi:hypothetical protein
MWTTASGRLPVSQLENRESAHLERLLAPAAVVQTTSKTILRRTGVGQKQTWCLRPLSTVSSRLLEKALTYQTIEYD